MAFAAVVIRRVSALGGEEEGGKDKETETVVAALAVLKAARENTVVEAGAGAWAGDLARLGGCQVVSSSRRREEKDEALDECLV